MIVCVCKRVSDRQIVHFAQQGHSLDDISFELGVATQCGCCRQCAERLVESVRESHACEAVS